MDLLSAAVRLATLAVAGLVFLPAAPASSQTTDRLFVRLVVGADDLREGSVVEFFARDRRGALLNSGTQTSTDDAGWPEGTEHTVWVPLSRPVEVAEIGSLVIVQGRGLNTRKRIDLHLATEDNWDLRRVDVMARPGGAVLRADDGRSRVHRFTDNARLVEVPLAERLPVPPFTNREHTTSELTLRVRTGDDDLRGGGDMDVDVYTRSGEQVGGALTLYDGQTWPNQSTRTVTVPLIRSVPTGDLGHLVLRYRGASGGTLGADNWNVARLDVLAGSPARQVHSAAGSPLHRFTDGSRALTVPLVSGPSLEALRQVALRLRTGDDDLHANSAVHARLFDAAGRPISDRVHLNRSSGRWGDRTTHTEVVPLTRAVSPGDIAQLVLDFVPWSGAFSTGDNWNLDEVEFLAGPGGGVLHTRTGRPLKRFTGDDRTLELRF